MPRLLKLIVALGALGALVVVARRLMGGLGPQPGSAGAPKEWPSLVPEPQSRDNSSTDVATNGSPPSPGPDELITPLVEPTD